MSKPIRIERWACKSVDPFRAPEVGYNMRLCGDVYGHPRYPDGDRVSTGAVVRVDGHTVETSSGSIYVLGEADPRYLSWLAEQGIPFDPERPIVVKARTK